MERAISFIGLLSMILCAFLLSDNRKKIHWKTVVSGIVFQILLGLLILKTSWGREVFEGARTVFAGILNFTQEGSNFIFGFQFNCDLILSQLIA